MKPRMYGPHGNEIFERDFVCGRLLLGTKCFHTATRFFLVPGAKEEPLVCRCAEHAKHMGSNGWIKEISLFEAIVFDVHES